jgi:hypothetical protein
MKNFWAVYPKLRGDLSDLLGMSFIPDSPDSTNAIGLTFDAIFQSHVFGDIPKRDMHLNRLDMLRKNLREIKDYDENVFRQFKRLIKRSNKIDDFFGIRFELNISATLIREKISFLKSESPDFLVQNNIGSAAIECTSTRIRKDKS